MRMVKVNHSSALDRGSCNYIVGYLLVEARHPSALARVRMCCIYVVGLSSLWFSLVDRACSWLFFISKDILYKIAETLTLVTLIMM